MWTNLHCHGDSVTFSKETLNGKLSVQYQLKVLKMIYTYELVYKKLVFISILFLKKTFRLSSVSAVKVWYFSQGTFKRKKFSQMLFKNRFFKFHRKTTILESLLDKVADSQALSFMKRNSKAVVFLWNIQNL